ncbi:MAG TPA: flagellar type III secretion system protein FlhB [Phycisphaerales bacterium]|nr:flagellar type III secretion system protein FlhB [Phycisphaerales bacterium]
MAEELGERTEQPTGRRLSEARARGQVARSVDLGAAIDLAGAALLLALLGPWLIAGLAGLTRELLDPAALADAAVAHEMGAALLLALRRGAVLALPLLGLMFVVAGLAQLLQVGWAPSLAPLRPKASRLSPLGGAKRLLGTRNLVKTLVSGVKLLVVGVVAALVIERQFSGVVSLGLLAPLAAARLLASLVLQMSLWVLALLLVIGLADFAYQRWQRLRDLRMTKQEVRDERRSMEGDTETRARRLRLARQMIMQRLGQAVPTADVIVTNPTHFSVALKYDSANMSAPRVVAKGADHLAFRIRELAARHAIPMIEKPPLARALYARVEVGRQIDPEFYEAVAEILAYVYRLKHQAA